MSNLYCNRKFGPYLWLLDHRQQEHSEGNINIYINVLYSTDFSIMGCEVEVSVALWDVTHRAL